MKKLINDPQNVVRESLEGFGLAHADLVRVETEPAYVLRTDAPVKGKVGLVSGGGSGHEPLHAGYVGRGMLDAAVPGAVFTSPTPDQILPATAAVDGGAGVLHIVKNYTGDVLNFETAAELAEADGIRVEVVLVNDDVAVEDSSFTAGRRGVAGTVLVEKIVGAAAERGDSLAEVAAIGRRVNDNVRSMGVALSPCTVPHAGEPSFELASDEIEIGIGIHGEPGRHRIPMEPADGITERLLQPILEDLHLGGNEKLLLLVNGMGGTPASELYIVYRHATRLLRERGYTVERSLVGNYITALDMQGASISILKLDDELTELWDAPVHTAAMRWEPEMALDAQWALAWLRNSGQAIGANRKELNDLDRAIGDGDHGENLDHGFRAVIEKLDGGEGTSGPGGVFKLAAMTLMSTVGGAAGPLYGTAFLRAATAAGEDPELDSAAVVAILTAARDGIVARGKAESGDKTMIDAWTPAVEAAAAKAGSSGSEGNPTEVLAAAADAAEAGATATEPLVARKGRASYLGERSAGHRDPGAVSSALLLRAAVTAAGEGTTSR